MKANPFCVKTTLDMMNRSICSVQVGAVLDDGAEFYTGWNHGLEANNAAVPGKEGYGKHAEVHCLQRAPYRLSSGAILYVASQRQRNAKAITSKPCERCMGWIEARGISLVFWRAGNELWIPIEVK